MSATLSGTPLCDRADARLNAVLSRLLLGGLVLAVALMVAGFVVTAARGEGSMPRTGSIVAVPGLLADLEPAGFFDLGLLLLLATPAARVSVLVVAFARRREWRFAALSAAVLAILAAGVVLGLGI